MKNFLCFLTVLLLSIVSVSAQKYKLNLRGAITNASLPDEFKDGTITVQAGAFSRNYTGSPNNRLNIDDTFYSIDPFVNLEMEEFSSSGPGDVAPTCNSNDGDTRTLSQMLNSTLSINGCPGVTTLRATLTPVITDILDLSNSGNEVCIGGTLSLGALPATFPDEAYSWQYSTNNGTTWASFPAAMNFDPQVNFTMEQLLGINHTDFLNSDILIRLGRGNLSYLDNAPAIPPITINYSSCAPLVNDLNYSPPNCKGDPINVMVTFDRPLDSSVDEKFASINLVEINTGLEIEQSTGVYMDTSTGKTYTFNNIDTADLLEGQEFRVIYQMGRGIDLVPGFIETTQTFTFNDATPVTFTTSSTDISCVSGQGTSNDGSIIISDVTGGTSSYLYSINGGNFVPLTGDNVTINRPDGDYTIQVKDTNDCTGTTSGGMTTITETINPATAIVITENDKGDATYNGGENGFIIADITGGSPFDAARDRYDYSWKDSSDNTIVGATVSNDPEPGVIFRINLPNLVADTYTLTITDDNGCTTNRSDFVINHPPVFEFDGVIDRTPVTCGDEDTTNDDGSITARAKGGIPNYEYQLLKQDPLGIFVTYGASETLNDTEDFSVTGLPGGVYRVQVKDNLSGVDNPLLVSGDIPINEPDVFKIDNVQTKDALCVGAATGSITLDIVGGTGVYSLSMTKSNDASFSRVINNIPNNSNDYVIDNLAKGIYTLTITDEKGCSIINPLIERIIEIGEPTTSVAVSVINLVSPTAGNADGSITVEGINGVLDYEYLWSPGGETTDIIDNLKADTYTVTITDGGGCTASQTFELEELSVAITVTSGEEMDCFGDKAGLTAEAKGGDKQYTYAWYEQNDLSTSIGSDLTISGLSEGDYIVVVTDGTGASVTSSVFEEIREPQKLEILETTNATINAVNCYGGNDGSIKIITSGGTGAIEYSIDNGDTYHLNPDFSFLSGGSIQVIVKDDNSCLSAKKVFIIPAPTEELKIEDTQTDVLIFGQNTGAIDITVTGGNGGYTYSWTGPNGYTSTDENIATLFAGEYTLVVRDNRFATTTDNDGCTITKDFIITEPEELKVTIAYETPNTTLQCYGDDNARLLATVEGGKDPYSYQWFKENPLGSDVFDPLTDTSALLIGADAGNYMIEVTDDNTATTRVRFLVKQPDELTIDPTTTDITCFGDDTGTIDIDIQGGTGFYSISWDDDDSETTEQRNDLIAGTYTVTVIDDNDCSTTIDIEIIHLNDEIIISNEQVIPVSVFEGNDGSITIDIEGGVDPYIISWIRASDGAEIGNTESISNLIAGDYDITITDSKNCSIVKTYTIIQPDVVEPTYTLPTCVGGCDGAIELTVTPGQNNNGFTYLWNTGATENKIENLCAGEYSVIIKFDNGTDIRTLERTYTLEDPEEIIIDLGPDKTLCLGQTYTIDGSIEDPGATYSWQSTNGFTADGANITVSESGIYTLSVTTSLGCLSADSIEIIALEDEINAEFLASTDLFVGIPFIIVDVSNPIPDTIEWILPEEATQIDVSNSHTEIVFNQAGDYTITLKTKVGDCEALFTKTITVLEPSFDRDDESIDGLQKYVIYPNPSKGNFTIDLTFDTETPIDIKLFGIASNTMLYQYQDQEKTEYTIPFNLEGIIPSGIYFILLETPQKTYIRKIVVE